MRPVKFRMTRRHSGHDGHITAIGGVHGAYFSMLRTPSARLTEYGSAMRNPLVVAVQSRPFVYGIGSCPMDSQNAMHSFTPGCSGKYSG